MKEDTYDPEPKKLIAKTFIFGILAAFLALITQAFFSKFLSIQLPFYLKTILLALIEEVFKYSVVLLVVVKSIDFNERIDPLIYMIVAALGFVAIENMFYIIDYINNLEYLRSLLNGSQRFVGATLIHVVSSAVVGIFMAFVFFQKKIIRRVAGLIGLLFATAFHAAFNFLIISGNSSYEKIAFYASWLLIVIVLIFFEFFNRDKKIRTQLY